MANRLMNSLVRTGSRLRYTTERKAARLPVLGPLLIGAAKAWARWRNRTPAKYVAMQKRTYERLSAGDVVVPGEIRGDYVVGSWRDQDAWPDYEEYLMRYVPPGSSLIALDFGCGPGRNLRRWSSRFARIDGVDISARNLENARTFLSDLPAEKTPNLYLTGGMDTGDAPAGAYDFAFSTICLQHICVHAVRLSIFQSLYRCLKEGGRLSVQMGFGVPSPKTVGYFDDAVDAIGTNRTLDTAIATPDEPRSDLEKIGFVDFEYWIRPVGPGDIHPNWIFFTAVKPKTAP